MLRIGPFNYDPIRGVDLWLAQSDEFLLTHLSTSPEVEPPHFTNQVGVCVAYIKLPLNIIYKKKTLNKIAENNNNNRFLHNSLSKFVKKNISTSVRLKKETLFFLAIFYSLPEKKCHLIAYTH